MNFITDYKAENFIVDAKWENLPEKVQERLKGCFVDLIGALVVGSKSKQFEAGLKLAERIYGQGEIPVIGSEKKFNFMGASAAYEKNITLKEFLTAMFVACEVSLRNGAAIIDSHNRGTFLTMYMIRHKAVSEYLVYAYCLIFF